MSNYTVHGMSQAGAAAKKPPSKAPKSKKPSVDKQANLIPAYFFAAVLFISSLGLNVYNVYNRFAPETAERFVASGIYDFIFALPVFSFVAFLVRVGALCAGVYVLKIMIKGRLWTNPIWLMLLFLSTFVLTVGLSELLLSIPFVVALSIVGIIQYLEIIFWNARKKTTILWCVVIVAYLIEGWMQYDMLPFHYDYNSAWGLIQGMAGMSFNWSGFRPVQAILGLIGLFGIEAGERIIGLVKQHA